MMQEPEFDANALVNDDELQVLTDAMTTKYNHYLSGRQFTLRNWLDDGGVYVTVTLANADESFYYPVEARVRYQDEEMGAAEAALFLFDYIDAYFEEYFLETEDLFIPIDWTDYEYEAIDFQLRGQVVNRKAEALAEKLLAEGVPYKGPNIIY